MPKTNKMDNVIAFLKTRRSTPPDMLIAPYPDDDQLREIAAIGLRVPDHQKLEPWRLVMVRDAKLAELAHLVRQYAPTYFPDPAKQEKITRLYQNAGSVMVMIYKPSTQEIPEWEQMLSMGAVGLSLVNGATALGFGASWMTGFLPKCPEICTFLGVSSDEKLVGLVHMGTQKHNPPERPRPNLDQKFSFL